jgi:hypothetical protein
VASGGPATRMGCDPSGGRFYEQAERQMAATGCGGQLDAICPSGYFGQDTYPDCLGSVIVGPSPAGVGGGSSAPSCFIHEYGDRGGTALVFAATFDRHTQYYVISVPEDSVDGVVDAFRREHGASLVQACRSYPEGLQEARRRCPNPTSAPGR